MCREDGFARNTRPGGVALCGNAEELRDEFSERPGCFDEESRPVRGSDGLVRAVPREARRKRWALPREPFEEEGVEIEETVREKKVLLREAEVHAGRIN